MKENMSRVERIDHQLRSLNKPKLELMGNISLNSSEDFLILCAGFEDRSVEILKKLISNGSSNFNILLIKYLPELSQNKFDDIIEKYKLEKIKTMGDSYMCAGGLPVPDPLHAIQVVQAAREMIELVGRKLMEEDDLLHFQVRIGIHTGPVVAGIVGMKKWQYDIWGDTVNIASRLESASEPGRINLSESTYQKIKEQFPCSYRGELEAKNRGALKMYYLV